MAANNLPAPVQALIERTLFALTTAAKPRHAEDALERARALLSEQLVAIGERTPDLASYTLGAIDTLSVLLVRALERNQGNRAFAFARRKHVPRMLQCLAKSPGGLRPVELSGALGLPPPTISALLKDSDDLGLTIVVSANDGRERHRKLSPIGVTVLESVNPTWSLPDEKAVGRARTRLQPTTLRQIPVSIQKPARSSPAHLWKQYGFDEPRGVISALEDAIYPDWHMANGQFVAALTILPGAGGEALITPIDSYGVSERKSRPIGASPIGRSRKYSGGVLLP
jgi:hypothetical protein